MPGVRGAGVARAAVAAAMSPLGVRVDMKHKKRGSNNPCQYARHVSPSVCRHNLDRLPYAAMKILVLPGDGIGPEITDATLEVLEAASKKFSLGLKFETQQVGLATLKSHGTTMPDGLLGRASEADGIMLGPLDQMAYPAREKGGINVSGVFRVKLDLYANIRPARSRPGIGSWGSQRGPHPSSKEAMDLVIVRECTEGFYADRNMYQGYGEFMPTPDMAMSMRKIT